MTRHSRSSLVEHKDHDILSKEFSKIIMHPHSISIWKIEYGRVLYLSYLPVLFVGFSFLFNDMIVVQESDKWKTKYAIGNMYGREVFLMPHKGVRDTI